jgi:membrane-bound ClpP family serine protease
VSHSLAGYIGLQLLQLALVVVAAFGLQIWLEWPVWVPWAAVIAWVIKEIAIYPFVRESLLAARPRGGADELRGAVGIAQEEMAPAGWIEVRGELWRAEVAVDSARVSKGARVRVREVRGLMLEIEPHDEGNPGD